MSKNELIELAAKYLKADRRLLECQKSVRRAEQEEERARKELQDLREKVTKLQQVETVVVKDGEQAYVVTVGTSHPSIQACSFTEIPPPRSYKVEAA